MTPCCRNAAILDPKSLSIRSLERRGCVSGSVHCLLTTEALCVQCQTLCASVCLSVCPHFVLLLRRVCDCFRFLQPVVCCMLTFALAVCVSPLRVSVRFVHCLFLSSALASSRPLLPSASPSFSQRSRWETLSSLCTTSRRRTNSRAVRR